MIPAMTAMMAVMVVVVAAAAAAVVAEVVVAVVVAVVAPEKEMWCLHLLQALLQWPIDGWPCGAR
jgi:hypothetical protein